MKTYIAIFSLLLSLLMGSQTANSTSMADQPRLSNLDQLGLVQRKLEAIDAKIQWGLDTGALTTADIAHIRAEQEQIAREIAAAKSHFNITQ